MRYIMQQKLFGLGGDSMVKNDRGENCFFVDGAALSIGRRLVIKDLESGRKAVIQQKIVSFTPTFNLRFDDGLKVTVKKTVNPLVNNFKIDLPGRKNDLEARGDLLHHEYSIYNGREEVARVSKRWFSLVDSYGIEIDDDQDDLLILACAVVIDEVLDMREQDD